VRSRGKKGNRGGAEGIKGTGEEKREQMKSRGKRGKRQEAAERLGIDEEQREEREHVRSRG
jgi:hypothetical protein